MPCQTPESTSRSPPESPHFQDRQPLPAPSRLAARHWQSTASKQQKKVRQSSNLREIAYCSSKRYRSLLCVEKLLPRQQNYFPPPPPPPSGAPSPPRFQGDTVIAG